MKVFHVLVFLSLVVISHSLSYYNLRTLGSETVAVDGFGGVLIDSNAHKVYWGELLAGTFTVKTSPLAGTGTPTVLATIKSVTAINAFDLVQGNIVYSLSLANGSLVGGVSGLGTSPPFVVLSDLEASIPLVSDHANGIVLYITTNATSFYELHEFNISNGNQVTILSTSPNQIYGPLVDEAHGQVIFSYYFAGDSLYDINTQPIGGGAVVALPMGNYVYFVDSYTQRVVYCIANSGFGSGALTCSSVKYDNTGSVTLINQPVPWTNILVDGVNGHLFVSVQNGTNWTVYTVSTIGGTILTIDSGTSGSVGKMLLDTTNFRVFWTVLNTANSYTLKSASYSGGMVTTPVILDSNYPVITPLGLAPAEQYVFYSATDSNGITYLKFTDVAGQNTPLVVIQGGGLSFTSIAVDEQAKTVAYSIGKPTLVIDAFDLTPPGNGTGISFLYFVIIIPIVVGLILIAIIIGVIIFVVRRNKRRHDSQFF